MLSRRPRNPRVEEHRPPGAPEQEIFDDGSGESGVWDRCDVVAFFALEDDAAEAVRCAADAVELPDARFELEEIANEGWVEQIKASYVPLRIADDLYIVPEWCEPEDPAALNIVMQPGVAFGTGEHPTTRLCLQHLLRSRQWLAGKRVMDYGTGSGVLAIAALKLGAAHATGTDTDSLAVQSAQRNGELSGVPPAVFEVYQCGAALDDPEPVERATGKAAAGGYDLVVANILRGPLVELQPRLASYVRSGGRLALSGILAEQAAEVVAAYSRDFADFQTSVDSTWALVTAVRKC